LIVSTNLGNRTRDLASRRNIPDVFAYSAMARSEENQFKPPRYRRPGNLRRAEFRDGADALQPAMMISGEKEAAMQAAELTAEFGIAGVLDFVETEHGLVKAAISLAGVAGGLYLQGAHLTAWQPPGERPVLFTSPNSEFAPGRAIRGGIPIIFPWFGTNRHAPAAPQHGFARTASWHLDGVETTGRESLTVILGLGDGDAGSPKASAHLT
jgi:hypothetical protein